MLPQFEKDQRANKRQKGGMSILRKEPRSLGIEKEGGSSTKRGGGGKERSRNTTVKKKEERREEALKLHSEEQGCRSEPVREKGKRRSRYSLDGEERAERPSPTERGRSASS